LIVWLRRVFWVMDGHMFAAGLLTVYLARQPSGRWFEALRKWQL